MTANLTGIAAPRSIAPRTAPERSQQPRSRLFSKFVLLFVALVGTTLVASGVLELWFSYQENKTALAQVQQEKALSAAARIEQFIDDITRQIGWTTRAQWSNSGVEQRRLEYLRLLSQAPAITEITYLDAEGRETLRISRLAVDVIGSGADRSSEAAFAGAKAGTSWFSPVYFRRDSEPYMTVAIAGTGRDSGVTVADVNLKFIWDVITRIKVGEAGYAYVVDSRGWLIAHPDIGLVLRQTDLSRQPQVVAAGSPQGETGDMALVGADLSGRPVLTAHATITPVGWTVFIDLPLNEAFAPLYVSLIRTAALMLFGLSLAVAVGLFLARRMVGPITVLQEGAVRIGQGDLRQRIDIRTGDEIQTLADRFNDMADRLEDSYANLERKVEMRTQELSEALERQTATSEILRVISSSPTDVKPVFETIAESASRLCDAQFCFVFRFDGALIHFVAQHGVAPDGLKAFQSTFPLAPNRGSASGRSILSGDVEVIPDVQLDPDYELGTIANVAKYRSTIAVPMIHDGRAIGSISLARSEAGSFPARQAELLQAFADQAVIALENVRLFTELGARNRELNESLQQQTATADVLKVISRSAFDLQVVLDTLIETAARLCEADMASMNRAMDDAYQQVACYRFSPELKEYMDERRIPIGRGSLVGRTLIEGGPVQISDVRADPEFELIEASRIGGFRSMLGVPLIREGTPIGVIVLQRTTVRPFTAKQIELVNTFADQAVIAIENVRLFNEVQSRTRELSEALEQQTATSEVLRVISSSPGELEPVFQAMLANATRICQASLGTMYYYEGGAFHLAGWLGASPALAELYRQRDSFQPSAGTPLDRLLQARDVIHIADDAAELNPGAAARFGGARSTIAVPMLKDGNLVGAIVIYRQEVRPFTDKQIDLVRSFANQAVIAIENVRLLKELRERTRELAQSVEELRALGEVSQAVNSTLDLQTVLNTIVAKAVQLSGTDAGSIYVLNKAHTKFRLRATYGMDEAMVAAIRDRRIRLGETAISEATEQRQPVQISDVQNAPSARVLDVVVQAGFRAILFVPLLGPDRAIGVLVIRRRTPGEFPKTTIELLQTFAAQSVLAIQNARLFNEIEEKGHQLEVASRHKSQFLANMSHELRTPLNAILGYSELVLDDIYGAVPEKVRVALERMQSNGKHLLGLINDVLDLAKIEAGRLTLSLSDYSLNEVVASVVASVEGLAAEKQLALKVELSSGLPIGRGDEQRIRQVLLNLVSNAIKFTDAGEVTIRARAGDGVFRVAVGDTGPGISAEDQAKLFQEFQQADSSSTRKKGGTGLGLAISRRFIDLQGGRIWVESAPGRGSTFTFELPITVEPQENVE